MDESKPGKDFWDRADQIVGLANDQCNDFKIGEVSSSLLYAAARFNSFVVGANAVDAEEMKKEKGAAIEYFTEQYRKILDENLQDYIENFEDYKTEN